MVAVIAIERSDIMVGVGTVPKMARWLVVATIDAHRVARKLERVDLTFLARRLCLVKRTEITTAVQNDLVRDGLRKPPAITAPVLVEAVANGHRKPVGDSIKSMR